MALKVGDTAPDFTLPKAPREPVSLGEYRGQTVVLLFFPLAYSSTCTEELCTVAENWTAWEAVDARVVGISVDSPYVNRRYAEDLGVPFPILSDFNKDVTRAYDVYREALGELRGVSERAAFVVNGDGVITYVWVDTNPGVMPPLEEIRRAAGRAAEGVTS